MRTISPRRLWHRSIRVPVYSVGVRMVAVRNGSSIDSSFWGSGISDGLCTSTIDPSVKWARYSTLGAVAMSARSNSRSRRSRTISICRSPRNPHRNPKPSAAEVSGS